MLEQAYGRQQGAHGRCAWGWEAAWGKCEGHRGNRGIYGRHCGVGGRGTLRGVGGRWEGCTQGGGRQVVGERAEHSKHGMGGVKNVVWSM